MVVWLGIGCQATVHLRLRSHLGSSNLPYLIYIICTVKKLPYKDPEKQRQFQREHYKNNKNKYKEKCKRWRENNRERCRESRRVHDEKNLIKVWADKSLYQHKKNGFDINVSKSFVYDMAKNASKCSICECELDWNYGKGMHTEASPTLDRINNENDLNENNIWIICYKCNSTKRSRTLIEFIRYCNHVVRKFG